MDDEELVTPEQKRKDGLVKKERSELRQKTKNAHIDAINKLPNELRYKEFKWNPHNMYHGDSYAGLYAEEVD